VHVTARRHFLSQKAQRFDTAEIQQGDVSGYGGNFLPQDKGRNVTAGFAEISVPVLKSLEFTGAARYDNYEGTGSRTTNV
jgi:iron complex outermembrane receptor protein